MKLCSHLKEMFPFDDSRQTRALLYSRRKTELDASNRRSTDMGIYEGGDPNFNARPAEGQFLS